MRKRIATAIAVIAPVAGAIGLTVPLANAAAVPSVQIIRVQYDSPGTDNRSNTSLNGEYILLTNTTRAVINLTGWTVRDNASHVYRFGAYSLGAGRRVMLHTGRGTNGKPDSQHVYWQSGAYIWNNDRDTAAVRNTAGRTVDSCSWARLGNGFSAC